MAEEAATEEKCPTSEPEVKNPFWFDMSGQLLGGMADKWRDDDIVISVPAKSGTTWTMNIVHQLRSKGDENMVDLYQHVHWLEFFESPYQTAKELYTRWAREPWWYPRAFKTHAEPPKTPFDPKVRYIVVMRDPRDAIGSMYPFFHAHNEELFDYFKLNEGMRAMVRPKGIEDVFYGFAGKGMSFFNFLLGWWPLRNEKNVLMLHYADMKKDHKGSIKKIQEFLGFELTDEEFENVCRLTSFEYMKANGEKYTASKVTEVPLMKKDGMVRNGAVGGHKKEMSEKLLEEFDTLAKETLSEDQLTWLLNGGTLP